MNERSPQDHSFIIDFKDLEIEHRKNRFLSWAVEVFGNNLLGAEQT